MSRSFIKQAIPCTLIDVINRRAAATGSCRYAQLTADADYNGHHFTVSFNEYRDYWVAGYTWSGWNVIRRGTLDECLAAVLQEYARGAKGTSILVTARDEADVETILGAGFEPGTFEDFVLCRDPRVAHVSEAFEYDRHFGLGAVGLLVQAASPEDYKARVEAAFAARRPNNRAASVEAVS